MWTDPILDWVGRSSPYGDFFWRRHLWIMTHLLPSGARGQTGFRLR